MTTKDSNIENGEISFLDFVWRRRSNRMYLSACALISLVLFFVFKLFYPYPSMVMDGYVYIRPLVEHLGTNSFPIGYSWFLQLFSLFSRSTTLLVWLQYLFLVAACLLFFFTLLFFFRPGRWVTLVLFIFLFLNPLFFYCSNFIMSDTLFTTLSILWITQLIWMIGSPHPYMIFSHAILLLLVFTVRYNALYYPLVAAFVLLLTRLRRWVKIVAIALQFALIGFFILYTQGQMKELTGIRQFSPFGGWKMANNALYMYGHVCQIKNDPVPEEFLKMDSMVRSYFITFHRVDDLGDARTSGGFYMADDESPLIQYMYQQYGRDTTFQNFKKWGPMGALCSAYGTYLVRKYPLEFCRYFLWPNITRYALTPTEVFWYPTSFYLRTDRLGQMAIQWFGVRTLAVNPLYINLRTSILSPYPVFLGLTHLAFILGLVGFALLGGIKTASRVNLHIVRSVAVFWLCDLFFKVTAGAIVLRHQLFLMILEFAFALLFIDFIYHNSDANPHHSGRKVLYEGAQNREARV